MAFTEQQRQKIIKGFLDWCEKIGYSEIKIEIVKNHDEPTKE